MPEETPASKSWQQYARDILLAILTALTAYTANTSRTVETRQQEVKTTLEKKVADEQEAMKMQLWNAYTQLLWRAEETGKQKDKDKAAEAKLVYDRWVAIMNGD